MFSKKSVQKQVSIFNETLINIVSNFTPNKLVTFDDRNPPWMNDYVKSKIKWKNQLYNTYVKNGYKFNDHLHFQERTNLVSEVIVKRKQDYYNNLALRLNIPAASSKTYWSILKNFFTMVKKFLSLPTFN